MPTNDRFSLQPAMVAIETLRPFARNARTHSKGQVKKLARSIEKLGIFNPLLVDDTGQILAGHARLEAARLLKLTHVPTLKYDHLTEDQKRAYVIADNKIAQDAGWDRDLLASEFRELSDLGFDLELTGFDTPEIDGLFSNFAAPEGDDEFSAVPADGPSVCKTGDIFVLGHHKIVCGDARERDVYKLLLADERASFVITDPPYNVKILGNVSGLGKTRHKNFKMACGELSPAEFTAWLHTAFSRLVEFSLAGSIHIIFMDWRHVGEMPAAGSSTFTELKNIVVWNKSNAGMGTFYRSKHELGFVWKNGESVHVNNFELGQHGRYRTNVWDYPSANTVRAKGQKDLELHPTPKPVSMIVDAIKDCSRRGEIVLDSFSGSGVLLIAAEQTGRHARCIELDPKYCDIAIRRWQKFSGKDAIRISDEQTFDELSQKLAGGTPDV